MLVHLVKDTKKSSGTCLGTIVKCKITHIIISYNGMGGVYQNIMLQYIAMQKFNNMSNWIATIFMVHTK